MLCVGDYGRPLSNADNELLGPEGLATSYALARAGHKVILLEKSDGTESVSPTIAPELRRDGADIQRIECSRRPVSAYVDTRDAISGLKGSIDFYDRSPPSMTRVLHQWGLKHIFDEIAQLCRGYVYSFLGSLRIIV